MEKEKLELLENFRQLCPANRNTVITVVSTALAAEQAMKRQYGLETEPKWSA
jgi:hypothetical protein